MNRKKIRAVWKKIFVFSCAAAVPAFLILDGIQTRRYENIENEIRFLEKKQIKLVQENRQLITNISILSSSDRIEKIAKADLGMHKAESDEIVRVEMKSISK